MVLAEVCAVLELDHRQCTASVDVEGFLHPADSSENIIFANVIR